MAGVQRDLTLIYEGVDITDQVDIIECVHRDMSDCESDCLNLKLDHADKWFRWGPKKNDRLRVMRSSYDTGTLYLSAIAPEDGAYRIFATGAKSAAFPARWQSFEDKTLAAVMALCAGENGMGAKLYGVSGDLHYDYLLRQNEGAGAFLNRLLGYEGAVLKALDGNFTAIGIEWAQGISPMHQIELDSEQLDGKYTHRRYLGWTGVTIDTPFGKGSARDSGATGQGVTISGLAVDNDAQARRWAKGILLAHNRQSEILTIEMDFNPGYTAMVRADVSSRTDANGAWIIESVEQNLLDGRTKARMLRCVTTIA